jgi:TonB family protein
MKTLAPCIARTFVLGMLVVLWPATPPATRAQEQATPAAAAAPATSTESAAIEALAAKMADAIRQLKAKSVVVFDFENRDGKVTPLGQKLSDEFGDTLAKDAMKFKVMPLPEQRQLERVVFQCARPDTYLSRAKEAGAKLAVIGKVSLEGDTITLKTVGIRVDNQKHTDTFRAQFPLTKELRELAQSNAEPNSALGSAGNLSPRPDAPASGNNGIGFPSCAYCPSADYSEEGKDNKVSGVVLMLVVVGVDGTAKDIVVQKCLGYGLDEEAVEAVEKWKFKPATGPDGKPVAVRVPIEVQFHLY